MVPLALAGAAAFACSYERLVWAPSSDTDPPYFSVWSGRKQGWIDHGGRWVNFEPESVARARDSLTPFQDGGFFGYSRQGRVVLPPRFLAAGEFHEERAAVVLEGPCIPPDAGLCGLPSILPPSGRLSSSVPRPDVPACLYTFIDEAGEVVGTGKFRRAADFHQGMAAIFLDGFWGYVDRDLSVRVEPRFRAAGDFSEGLAAVSDSATYFYIDPTGRAAIQGPFDWADQFHEGLAVVYRNERAHYIDRSGRQAVPGIYAHAAQFFHGLANVQLLDGRLAYIERTGHVVFQWKRR
jgi:hypothetical protein